MNLLASAGKDTTIRIWSTDNWECERVLKGHQGLIKGLACDGKFLYSGSADNTLRIWDVVTLEPVAVLPAQGKMPLEPFDWWGGVSQVAIDDHRVYAGQGNGMIAIYSKDNFSLETCIKEEKNHDIVKLIVDDRYIYALNSLRFTIREKDTFHIVYDTKFTYDLWTIELDSNFVYTGSHVWSIPDMKYVSGIQVGEEEGDQIPTSWVFEEIHAVAIDEKHVYVGCEGYPHGKKSLVVHERDGRTWNVISEIPNQYSEVLLVDDTFIYSGEFSDVRIISKEKWQVEHVLKGHDGPVFSLALMQGRFTPRSIQPKIPISYRPRERALLRHGSD